MASRRPDRVGAVVLVVVLALAAALGLEVRQGSVPAQALDAADAWLSVVVTGLALALVACLDRSHLRPTRG